MKLLWKRIPTLTNVDVKQYFSLIIIFIKEIIDLIVFLLCFMHEDNCFLVLKFLIEKIFPK